MTGRIAIICDFDGTITERDVGHHFFGTYVPDAESWHALLEKWKIGLISSRECLEQELEWAQARLPDLDEFIEGEKIDPYFRDFVDFCNREKYEFLILSDGLDYYIEAILMNFGLGYLEFRANGLLTEGEDLSRIEFPWFNMIGCKMCGNCKKYHVELLSDKGFYTIYIGNGYSDRCPAEYADMVFAKDDLLEHFRQKKLDCVEFSNFRDVEREMTRRLYLGGTGE